MESVYKEVKRRCHAEKRVTPSRNSVLKRIRALDARLVARKRLGAKSAESIALSTPGMLEATEALELIQIDHTLADVMIVDSVYRCSIGRPWLSLAIDVATRSVLGFHLGLEAPSALAVALCIEHAVLPKIRSAAAPVTEASWDMFGVPKTILVDNGSEFHGEALTRGCVEYGIALTYRPVARPRFGAHVERLIGTMMGRIHLLPGSTDSSPTARGSYQSENEAKLTLAELNEWLYLEIAGQYHHDIHRMIGTTPAAAWAKSMARGTVPVLPADPARFVIGFLPIVHRKLQRNGLFFERIRYWADVLPSIAQPREPLLTRYDPRDLSRLWVLTPTKSCSILVCRRGFHADRGAGRVWTHWTRSTDVGVGLSSEAINAKPSHNYESEGTRSSALDRARAVGNLSCGSVGPLERCYATRSASRPP